MNVSIKRLLTSHIFRNNLFIAILFLISFLILQGCEKSSSDRQDEINRWSKVDGKIKVLTTTEMINNIVKQVGGEYAASISLIQGELDPHSYQLVKGDDEKLNRAELIFYNGLGLEHGPSLHHYLKQNRHAVALGDLIYHDKPERIVFVSGQKDPHIWMDISLWSETVPFILEAFIQKDPQHAEYFRANARKLQNEMAETDAKVKQILAEIPEKDRYLVTSHDAFNYFARAYLSEPGEVESGEWQKRFAAPEGLAPESQLSTTHIKMIIDYLSTHQIHILFPETNVSRDSIRKIVKAGQEQGLDVKIACCPLYGDAMGPPGSDGDTYLKMILHNAKMLAEHMAHPDKKHDNE